MKSKSLSSVAALLALAVAVIVTMVPSRARAEGAEINKDVGCTMYDANGNLTVIASDSVQIGTNSQRCNSTISCKAKGVDNTTGKAIHWDTDTTSNGLCSTGFGITDRWSEIISTSGVAHLICHVNTGP